MQQIFLLYQFKQMCALWLSSKQLSFWREKVPILAKIGLYYIMKKKKRGTSVMKSNEPTLRKWTSNQMPLFLLHKHDARFLSRWCTCRDVSWTLGSFLLSRIVVAKWMHRQHDQCTAAISTSALKESDGPSYFHLINGDLIVNRIVHEDIINFWHVLNEKESKGNHNLVLHYGLTIIFCPLVNYHFTM